MPFNALTDVNFCYWYLFFVLVLAIVSQQLCLTLELVEAPVLEANKRKVSVVKTKVSNHCFSIVWEGVPEI